MRFFLKILLLFIASISYAHSSEDCPFCDSDILNKQTVLNGKMAVILLDYAPVTEGHLVIVPKRGVEKFEELNKEELEEIREMINISDKVFKNRYNIDDHIMVQKNGETAGQVVKHLHFHLVPSDSILETSEIIKKLFSGARRPISNSKLLSEVKVMREYYKSVTN